MPEPFDEEVARPPGAKDAPRRTTSKAPRGKTSGEKSSAGGRGRIECEIHDGVPTVRGKAQAHYFTGQSGQWMLVMDRKQGERIRINDTTEIVILEVNQQQVTIAVETSSAAEQTGKESSNEKK